MGGCCDSFTGDVDGGTGTVEPGIDAENAGVPIAGGPFDTVNLIGLIGADGGGGVLDITAPAPGIDAANNGVPIAGGPFTAIDLTGITGANAGGGVLSLTAATPLPAPLFGSGYDGALNFDGASNVVLGDGTTIVPAASVYTLPRDIFGTDIEIAAPATVKTAGNGIFATGTLHNLGLIDRSGGAGGNGVIGAGGAAGAAPATTTACRYGNGTAGQVGAATGGFGTSSIAPTNAHFNMPVADTLSQVAPAPGQTGGQLQGGAGGIGAAHTGGNGAGNATANPILNSMDLIAATTGRSAAGNQLGGGSGGGSGGGASGGAPGGSGGSGAGGGVIGIFARYITGNGSIRARGGNGGDAHGTSNAGGGGGGGGGIVAIATSTTFPIPNTVSVAGGLAGHAFDVNAGNGGAGGAGMYYRFQA